MVRVRAVRGGQAALDDAGFVPITLAYGRGGHGGAPAGLTLLFNGSARLRGLVVPAWAPAPSWRFGFGARSGAGASTQVHLPQ